MNQTTKQIHNATEHTKTTTINHYVQLGTVRNGEFIGAPQWWFIMPKKGIAVYQGEKLSYSHDKHHKKVEYFKEPILHGYSEEGLISYLGKIGAATVFGGSLTSDPDHLQEFTPIKEGDVIEQLCSHGCKSIGKKSLSCSCGATFPLFSLSHKCPDCKKRPFGGYCQKCWDQQFDSGDKK